MIFGLLFFCFSNFCFAKYCEKFNINYFCKIAYPILEIEKEEKVIFDCENGSDDLDKLYSFKVKNYNTDLINSQEYKFCFNIESEDDEISYELWDVDKNIKVNFENKNSETFSVGLNKYEKNFELRLNFNKENISKNSKIKLKIFII